MNKLVKEKIAFYLDDLTTPVGRALNLVIACLVLVSSGIFVAETYSLPEIWRTNLNIADALILAIFVIEYLLRFWCAESKFQYLFSLYSAIDLIAILPLLLGAVDITFIRLLRWFRFLRLIRLLGNQHLTGRIGDRDSSILIRILFTLFAIVFVFSGLIYQVEHVANSKYFATFLDAFYFSIFTMTTVGYGDVTPVTEGGRLMTVLMVLTGIALIPVQLGELLKRLLKTTNQIEVSCTSCGLALHDLDAQFCKACGAPLPKPNSLANTSK